jgi:hypothetical protein
LKRAILGLIFSVSGILGGISPFFLGIILQSNAAGWFMIATIPAGVLFSIFGLVWMIMGIIYCLRQKAPSQDSNPELRAKVIREKAISLALLTLPLLLIQPFIAFVLVAMVGAVQLGLLSILVSSSLILISSGLATYYAIISKQRKLQIIIIVTSLISVALALFLGDLWNSAFVELNSQYTNL